VSKIARYFDPTRARSTSASAIARLSRQKGLIVFDGLKGQTTGELWQVSSAVVGFS
jgi:hypothetical protein